MTEIPLTAEGATKNVLVWITDLSATSGKNQSGIAEVAFTAAS